MPENLIWMSPRPTLGQRGLKVNKGLTTALALAEKHKIKLPLAQISGGTST
jgi:hypothetical protein